MSSIRIDAPISAALAGKFATYETAFKEQNWARALDALNDMLVTEPRNSTVLVCRSHLYGIIGDAPSAIADAEKALEADGNNAGAYVQLGHLLISQGKLEPALSIVEEAAMVDRYNPSVLHLRALLNFLINQFGLAAQDAAHVLTSPVVSTSEMASAASIFGTSVAALRDRNDLDELDNLNLSLPEGAEPMQPPAKCRLVNPGEWAARMVVEGQRFYERGTHEDVEKATLVWASCRDVFRVVGDHVNATSVGNKLAMGYKALGRTDLADRAALSTRSAHRSVSLSKSGRLMAEADRLARDGESTKALAAYREAADLYSDDLDFNGAAKAYYEAAALQAGVGLHADALKHLKLCVELSEGVKQPFLSLKAHNLEGECFLKLGKTKEARDALAAALELHSAVYETNNVASASELDLMEFVETLSNTHERIAEACIAAEKYRDALEWLERSRSFANVDVLGEQIAREGVSDIVATEMLETLAENDLDVLLSISKSTRSNRVHLFLLICETGEVQYAEATWNPRVELAMHRHAESAAKLAGVSVNNPNGTGEMPAAVADGSPNAFGSMSIDNLGTSAHLATSNERMKKSQQQEGATAAQLRMRAAVAAAEAQRKSRETVRVEAVAADQLSELHTIFDILIAPFRQSLQQLAAQIGYPARCVISCSPTFFGVPWGALQDPKSSSPMHSVLRPVVITSTAAQWRRNQHRWSICNGTAEPDPQSGGSQRALIRVAPVIDTSIPTARTIVEAAKRSTSGTFGVNFIPSSDAGSTAMKKVLGNARFSGCTVLHLALRWVQRQMLKESKAIVSTSTETNRLEARPIENVDGIFATSALLSTQDKDVTVSHDGWLFTMPSGTASFPLSMNVPVVAAANALTVRLVGETQFLPGGIVVLDLETGWEDGCIATPTLPRAFLTAGASAVVVPSWSVPGDARRVFWEVFYAALAQHPQGSVVAAFDAAVERLRAEDSRLRHRVDLWGAFRLYM